MRKALPVLALLLVVALMASAAPVALLAKGSTWKFDASGKDLGPAWKESAYDDSAWKSGKGALGFGDSWIVTQVTPGFITYYFRTTISVEDPAKLTKLTLSASYDDGFALYLNGKEAYRKGIVGDPAAPVSFFATGENHEGASYETFDLTAKISLLAKGVNVVAVEVHQQSATSSDLSWDAELVAE